MKRIIALLLVLVMAMSLFAGCDLSGNKPTEPAPTEPTKDVTASDLDNARAFLKTMYKDSNGTQTKRDYTVVSVVSIGDRSYNVTWTIETVAGDAAAVAVEAGETTTTIKILNNEPTEKVEYNLVGTITNGTDSVSVSFAHYIEPVTIKDPVPGSTVTIAYALALGATKDHNTYTEGKYYITGVITEIYNETYGNMKITDADGNILTIYGTFNEDGTVRFDAMETKPAVGDTVTIYGIIGQYNGTPQVKNGWIMPAKEGAGDTLSIADALSLGASMDHNTYTEGKYYVTGVITEIYNETYGNMKITDAEGNILTIYGTYNADGTVRFDAMETKPAVGDTVTIYGIVGQYNGTPQIKNGWICEDNSDKLSIADALVLGASMEHNTYTEDKYYVTGVITEIYNETYGNMKLTDAEGNILTIYGTYNEDGTVRFDAMETKPAVGDTVTIYGAVGQYNDTPQIKNGWITKIVPAAE